MTMFEIDFMRENFEFVPTYRTVAGEAEKWLVGLSNAGESRGLAMQLCTDTPRDVMSSVMMNAVTQFRVRWPNFQSLFDHLSTAWFTAQVSVSFDRAYNTMV